MNNFNWKWFRNNLCEFYPCHKGIDHSNYNCKFCFCPLYSIDNCGGDVIILPNGIKDCSLCGFPHDKESHDAVIHRIQDAKY